jgi:uncharacterized protein
MTNNRVKLKGNILEITEDETTYTIVYEKIKKENEADETDDTMVDEIIDESVMDENETEIDEDVELDENENDVIEDEETKAIGDEEIEVEEEEETEEEEEMEEETEEEIEVEEEEIEEETEEEEDEDAKMHEVGSSYKKKKRDLWDNNKTEKRFFNIETRITKRAKKNIVTGHAAIFGQLSEDLGGFKEKIKVGAFDGVLKNDVRAFFNHDPNFLLARTTSGTLKLAVDKVGLSYSFEVPDTTAGRDLVISMERGDITQSSFAFMVEKDSWSEQDGQEIRTIEKVGRLFDVSPVSIPAYPQANDLVVAKRSRLTYKDKTKIKKENEWQKQADLLKLKINILKRKLKRK